MNLLTKEIYKRYQYLKLHDINNLTYKEHKYLKQLEKEAMLFLDKFIMNVPSYDFTYGKFVTIANFIMDMELIFLYHNYPEEKTDKLMADITKLNKGKQANRFENPDVHKIIMTLDESNTTVAISLYHSSDTVDSEDYNTNIEISINSTKGRKISTSISIVNDELPEELGSFKEDDDNGLIYIRYNKLVIDELKNKVRDLFKEYYYNAETI